jgi:hypothetical protein
MPKFFEWKVCKDMLIYLPRKMHRSVRTRVIDPETSIMRYQDNFYPLIPQYEGFEAYGRDVGPFGIPSQFNWQKSSAIQRYLHDRVMLVRNPSFSKLGSDPLKTCWERGIEYTQSVVALYDMIEGKSLEVLSYNDSLIETESELSSRSGREEASGGKINRRSIIKEQGSRYIRIDRPEEIIKKKELPYSLMVRTGSRSPEDESTGGYKIEPVKRKMRLGSLLRSTHKRVNARRSQVDEDIEPEPIANSLVGSYVLRSELSALLKVDPFTPGLFLRNKYFKGKYSGIPSSEVELANDGRSAVFSESELNLRTTIAGPQLED